MGEAEVLVNIGGCHLSSCNRADDRSGTGHAVSPCKDSIRILHIRRFKGGNATALDRQAVFSKFPGINPLPDRNQNPVSRKLNLRFVAGFR